MADSYEARHAGGMEPENIDKVGALAFVITEGGMGGFVTTNVDILVVGMRRWHLGERSLCNLFSFFP